MNKRGILFLVLTLLCSLRACQLYWSSTRELRSTDGHSWSPLKKKKPFSETTTDRLKNDSIILGTEPNNIFYFLHVNKIIYSHLLFVYLILSSLFLLFFLVFSLFFFHR